MRSYQEKSFHFTNVVSSDTETKCVQTTNKKIIIQVIIQKDTISKDLQLHCNRFISVRKEYIKCGYM